MPPAAAAGLALALALLASSSDPADPRVLPVESRAVVKRETPHLSFTAALSSERVAPGDRLTIEVDVVPKPGIHVYAPGTPYRAIALVLKPRAGLRVHDPVYPEPELYLFKPLNEAVMVYSRPFRLAVGVTAGATPRDRAKLRTQQTLELDGALEYQACDDRVCYLPASLPVSWKLQVAAGPAKNSAPRSGSAAQTSPAQP